MAEWRWRWFAECVKGGVIVSPAQNRAVGIGFVEQYAAGHHIDMERPHPVGFGGVGMVEVVGGACAKWAQHFRAPRKNRGAQLGFGQQSARGCPFFRRGWSPGVGVLS
jgi:hypothetical protein